MITQLILDASSLENNHSITTKTGLKLVCINNEWKCYDGSKTFKVLILEAKDVKNGSLVVKKSGLKFISMENEWIYFCNDEIQIYTSKDLKVITHPRFVLVYKDNKLLKSWGNYQRIYMQLNNNNYYFLIKLSKHNYVRIYEEICFFYSSEEILDYQFKIKNFDFAITNKGNYYFKQNKPLYIENNKLETFIENDDCVLS